MCIIIKKPAGITLKDEIYRECFRIHHDGLGITYVDTELNSLVTEKGFMNITAGLDAIRKNEKFEMLIHFRRVSRGMVSKDNCHPFAFEVEEVDGEEIPRFSFSVAHNGTLPFWSTGQRSDTYCFVEEVLKPQLEADPWFLDRRPGKWFFEEAVGRKNKLVILRYDNVEHVAKTYIINENVVGTNTAYGCWFSNQTWWPPAPPVANTGTDGEGTPDHLGWIWRHSKSMFENVNTHAFMAELSYRKPMDNDYIHEGKAYKRITMTRVSGNAFPNPTQTVLPGVVSIKNGDLKSAIVPRDEGVLTGGDDDHTKSHDMAVRLNKCDMTHLTNRQKKQLRNLAKDFTAASLGEANAKTIDVLQMITFLRHEYLEAFPGSASMTLEELDNAILDAGGLEPKAEKEEKQTYGAWDGYAGGMGMGMD